MARVYLSIGSNIDREHNVRSAVRALNKHYQPLVLSSVYESVAVGFEGDPFYNLVAAFDAGDVTQVTQTLHTIEEEHGRIRGGKKFSSRTLDLDLLLFDDLDLHDQGIDVPRDEITRYAFVLGPLAEIAPQAIHPTLQQRYIDLWRDFQRRYPHDVRAIRAIPFAW